MIKKHILKWIRFVGVFGGALLLAVGIQFGVQGCGDSGSVEEEEEDSWCGDGVCNPDESPSVCPEDCPSVCGDGWCTGPDENHENCPADCGSCELFDDVTDLIGGEELFFGYSDLGNDLSEPSCGGFGGAKEIYLSVTPDFTGDLVFSTLHPSTNTETLIEVRGESCEGAVLACNREAFSGVWGSQATVAVQEGSVYVAMVETADNEGGIFALSLHRAGVCEGVGDVKDISSELLTGAEFLAQTSSGAPSVSGSCGGSVDNPEALLTFTAPWSGEMVATTVRPGTDFDTLMFVRRGDMQMGYGCGSPEGEIACENNTDSWGNFTVLAFQVLAGKMYHLFIDGGASGSSGHASVMLGYGDKSPAQSNLQGCDHQGIQDRFAFFAKSGEDVHVKADTVDAATAADLRMRVSLPNMEELVEADDDFDCTFPPPAYSCPEHSFTAGEDGLYFAEVYVGSTEQCYDYSLVNYKLEVTVDGNHTDLILVKDQ